MQLNKTYTCKLHSPITFLCIQLIYNVIIIYLIVMQYSLLNFFNKNIELVLGF